MMPGVDAGQLGATKIGRVVFSAAAIHRRVGELASEITLAYGPADQLLILGLLKGSFLFMADLVREISLPLQVDFLVASSYSDETVSSGDVRLLYEPQTSLEGRAVLVLEDIVDSGTTLEHVIPRLAARGPKSLEVCALLHKRLRPLDVEPRWVGFDAPKDFLVGYGLDYAQDFRHLPYIATL